MSESNPIADIELSKSNKEPASYTNRFKSVQNESPEYYELSGEVRAKFLETVAEKQNDPQSTAANFNNVYQGFLKKEAKSGDILKMQCLALDALKREAGLREKLRDTKIGNAFEWLTPTALLYGPTKLISKRLNDTKLENLANLPRARSITGTFLNGFLDIVRSAAKNENEMRKGKRELEEIKHKPEQIQHELDLKTTENKLFGYNRDNNNKV